MFFVLGPGGLASLLVGLWWDAILREFAADLARTENFFNLINPNHISLVHATAAGIVGLGHFLIVFGAGAMLAGLIWAIDTSPRSRLNPWRIAPNFRRAFVVGASALALFAAGSATWAASAVSYEDKLAAEPGGPSARSAGQKEGHHAGCEEHPTPRQREAAGKLAADTKAEAAKYQDSSVAEAAGYRAISPDWRPITHYLNPAYQRDGEILDPTRPEALVYANTSEGAILLGAMYLMPEPGATGPRIGGCLTRWHAHSLQGWETPEMMHVWTAEVPGGPFSELKPRQFISALEDQPSP